MGLLLYGMQVMSEGLQKIAGHQLRRILSSLTQNRFIGLVVGALVTMLFQSSTATTVILVGLTSAGVIALKQCLPVILGADIGTTVTAQLIALKVTKIALPIVGVGATIIFFSKRDRYRRIGQAITGFGLLFLGLKIMADAMHPLRDAPIFKDMLLAMSDNVLLAVVTAAIFTFLIHSSAASIGIIMLLAMQELITLESAIYLILGANVGTSFTAILSSLGSRREAQRVAMAHFLAKLGGTCLFLPFVGPYAKLLQAVASSPIFQVANAHTFFNVGIAIIFLPFTNFGVWVLEKILPDKVQAEFEPKYLDESLISTPSIAIGLAYKEIIHLSAEILRMTKDVDRVFRRKDMNILEDVLHKEQVIDALFAQTNSYLTRILRQPLDRGEFRKSMGLVHVLHDLEHIGDIIDNSIAGLAQTKIQQGYEFSPQGWQELNNFHHRLYELMRNAHKALVRNDYCLAEKVITEQPKIARLERELRQTHIHRLTEGIKETEDTSGIHLELLNSYLRISEHVRSIALVIAEELVDTPACTRSPQEVSRDLAEDVEYQERVSNL
ncbi:MAG: Na/Pi cotransporter family protein [Peptococcaceae bacterium]|nr:Na/Pi cotransporter family protein [Peptococcaceae bacterium]